MRGWNGAGCWGYSNAAFAATTGVSRNDGNSRNQLAALSGSDK
jgi:hypothetical protein